MITSGAKALKEMAMLCRSAGSAAPPKGKCKVEFCRDRWNSCPSQKPARERVLEQAVGAQLHMFSVRFIVSFALC